MLQLFSAVHPPSLLPNVQATFRPYKALIALHVSFFRHNARTDLQGCTANLS